MSRIGTTRAARFISRRLGWKLDPVLPRLTGNRVATTMVTPTACSRRAGSSGKCRRTAVIYFHDHDRAVIAASNAGADRHPEWYYSVLNDAQVTFGGAPMQAAVVEQLVEQERLRTDPPSASP